MQQRDIVVFARGWPMTIRCAFNFEAGFIDAAADRH
jgi:hypothetical protein